MLIVIGKESVGEGDRIVLIAQFSHVQHLVSEVSGVLRPGKTRFDAFRSIFPAGTSHA
jgi:anthranilate synthase component 1